jgi:single-strand DNA-binding protein
MANFNFNKVIIGGRLTADAELKQTTSGISVTAFSIAVNRKGAENKTDFIDCVAWRQTAEFICKYFKKGSSICIVGNLQKREWTDKNGAKRYATEVIAEEVSFVDSKSDSASDSAPNTADTAPKFEEISTSDDLPF